MQDPSMRRSNADKWLILVAISVGMFLSLLDHTIVNVMIPRLQVTFGAPVRSIQWVVTIYMLTQAAVIPTAPYLAARFGTKRAYVGALAAFLIGSLLCGLAWDLPSLIAARLLQGIGGGIMLPLVMTILYQTFKPGERGAASSTMGMALMVAPTLGPVFGGYLVEAWSWQAAFLINLPLGAVALGIAQRWLKPTPVTAQTRFDLPGFTTVGAGSVLLLYAVSTITPASLGGSSLLLLAGLACLGMFVAIERKTIRQGRTPLLDLRAFGDRVFALSSIAHVCVAFARFGILFLFPIYLQSLRQLDAFTSGALLGVQALATVVTLRIAGRLADRFGPRPIVIAGLVALIGALLIMATLTLGSAPLVLIGANLVLLGTALGLISQLPVAAMAAIHPDQHAAVANASTLLTVLHATAAPLGVAALSTLMQLRGEQELLAGLQQSLLLAAGVVLVALAANIGILTLRRTAQTPKQHAATI